MRSFNIKRVHIIRIDKGEEVISTIVRACEDNGIRAAVLSGLGLLGRAKLAVFNP
ncbi:MAG TPA: DNA-binding protein, partial [Candidatus Korarchaeota archaeon]|nr:DNA-binding protein [Candidatus Korarchaeota archaeon]